MESVFLRYIRIGGIARTSPNYELSNIFNLEQLLLERRKFVNDANVERSFVALIAPSLTGKTQAAFTIDKIRPLYFALDYSIAGQEIYKQFSGLNNAIKEAAVADYDRFCHELVNNVIPKLRPGISFAIFDFIMNHFKNNAPYNILHFIDSLLIHVKDWLLEKN